MSAAAASIYAYQGDEFDLTKALQAQTPEYKNTPAWPPLPTGGTNRPAMYRTLLVAAAVLPLTLGNYSYDYADAPTAAPTRTFSPTQGNCQP